MTEPGGATLGGPEAIPLPTQDGRTELSAGSVVGHFRVRRLIGEGGMGRVYLAQDSLLGRTVALKMIRPDLLSPGALRRFLGEARATAAISHPNIVTIHAFGEHEGVPYLALEYLEGESLAARIASGPLSKDEARRIGAAIADAMAHAHCLGVLHCDLKPSNVVIPRDGRPRVVDFGLAHFSGSTWAEGKVAGTPAFMAPEQWRKEAPTPSTDVWALGILLCLVLGAGHPFHAAARMRSIREVVLDPAVPPELDAVDPGLQRLIRATLERDPVLRPSARELADALSAPTRPLDLDGTVCPFQGLDAFEAEHAHQFFGREEEIEGVVERLRVEPFLAVVGASGSGKSSFVRAGVLPRLAAQGRWRTLILRPGSDPFYTLAEALAQARSEPDAVNESTTELKATLETHPALLGFRLAELARSEDRRVALFVDQLEELCTLLSDGGTRTAFMAAIKAAAEYATEPVRVIVSLRDDFLGRFPEVDRVTVLRTLRQDELRRAIVRPLERLGYHFEDEATVEGMIREVMDRPGALPLLQFTCRCLWDRRDADRRLVPSAAYEAMGGISGALVQHADQILDGLDATQIDFVRSTLLSLVSEGGARLAVRTEQLLESAPQQGAALLARLTKSRLLVVRRSGPTGSTVELAHEALITRWPRLAHWLEESDSVRAVIRELEDAAAIWARRGERDLELWPEEDIRDARRKLVQSSLPISATATAFLARGDSLASRERRRRLWFTSVSALALMAITVLAVLFAVSYRERERRALELAESVRLAGANLGRFTLALFPFDAVDRGGRPVPAPAGEIPALRVSLHAPAPGSLIAPGEAFGPDQLRVHPRTSTLGLVLDVEAPGGLAFLKVDGRGRVGEVCRSSWLRLQSLPGYRERDRGPPQLSIPVPTCRATRAGMVQIPAGLAIVGGIGSAPSLDPDDAMRERTLRIDDFLIDRTEVSNALFRPFLELAGATGWPSLEYPLDLFPGIGDPDHPVTNIDAVHAAAFCEYLGRRLPSREEWVKAARGGLTLPGGSPNPAPRRSFPWGSAPARAQFNASSAADGYLVTAPVESFLEGASPYGVLNLSGNVAEWTASQPEGDDASASLRVVMGGDWDSPPGSKELMASFENTRNPRSFDYAQGFRCAADPM